MYGSDWVSYLADRIVLQVTLYTNSMMTERNGLGLPGLGYITLSETPGKNLFFGQMDGQTADRQTDRQADRQADRQTGRQTDRQTDRGLQTLMIS